MTKKKPAKTVKKARAAKQKAATALRRPTRPKDAPSGVALQRAATHSVLLMRRAVGAHAESAANLEQARQQLQDATAALGEFKALEANRQGRYFYNFLAQGDSWFDYPCGTDIINCLSTDLYGPDNAYFNNLAVYGAKLRDMLSTDFKRALGAGPPNAPYWHAVLLSGGGNDMCADGRFADWLNPYDGSNSPAASYISAAFGQELAVLQGLYEQAIALVTKAPRSPRLFVHSYDFAIPDDRCVTHPNTDAQLDAEDLHFCFAGPWLWPAFEKQGFHKAGNDNGRQLSCAIVVAILKRFADMLSGLQQRYPNQLTLVPTQGTLQPTQTTKLWNNELHPENDSFMQLAQKFYSALPHT